MLFLAKQHLHDDEICLMSVCLAQWALQNAAASQEPDNFYSTTTCMNGVNVAKTHSFRHFKSGPRFLIGVFSQLNSVP